MEFVDMCDDVIEEIFKRLNDDDLDLVALTCHRLQRIVRGIFYRKYKNAMKLSIMTGDSSNETLRNMELRTDDGITHSYVNEAVETVLLRYPHIEVLYLSMVYTWDDLATIATHFTNLRCLELDINVWVYGDIFLSMRRLEQCLQIVYEKKIPLQRISIDMELDSVDKWLRIIHENLPQLTELELYPRWIDCVDKENADNFRFETLEKLSLGNLYNNFDLPDSKLFLRSIEKFHFIELKELTLKALRTSLEDSLEFIVRHEKLQKLKLIACDGVTAEAVDKLITALPQLKEFVVDVDEQLDETCRRHFARHWTISIHSEKYCKEWKTIRKHVKKAFEITS